MADAPKPSEEVMCNYLRRSEPVLVKEAAWRDGLYSLFSVLRDKIRDKKDTIWAFVLKNVFKPLLLRDSFDVLVGNPPWLSYRYVERGGYQEFLKKEITEHYALLVGRPELLTHMELGTLFFVRAADLYLRDGGRIGFVLPKSIFVADQHHAFRQGNHAARLRLQEVWDLEGVRPLFNVPASVAFGEKSPGDTKWPLAGQVVTGELEVRNASPSEAAQHLTERGAEYWLSIMGTRSYFSEKKEKAITEGSPYGKKFAEGATVVPRSFWFVQIQDSVGLGVDASRPYVKTDARAIRTAKEQYQDVRMEGNVESEFLYATLLSTDLVPFGHLPFRRVVLPILWKSDGYKMLTAADARKEGYLGLAEWLDKCERIWTEKQGEKAGRMTIYQRLDRYRGLTQQRRKRYSVVYPKSATYLCAGVIESTDGLEQAGHPASKFVADHVLYYTDLDSSEEAHYISAILNAPVVDTLVKPLQSRGDFGPRDIHKKMWAFPIPSYDASNPAHKKLASLGADCTCTAATFVGGLSAKLRGGSLGRLRTMIRENLRDRISEIDSIVKEILQ
jgi:hypothetical protein